MIVDNDLGLAPFVPITLADRAAAQVAQATNDLADLTDDTRGLIASAARMHPAHDSYFLAAVMDVDHGIRVSPHVVVMFLAAAR